MGPISLRFGRQSPLHELPSPGPRLQPVAPPGTVTCRECSRRIAQERFNQNLCVCPWCGRHGVVSAAQRVEQLADESTAVPVEMELGDRDPLTFNDGLSYVERVASVREKTGLNETFLIATATVGKSPVVLACMDFSFFGGSLGSAAGEAFAQGCDIAVRDRRALIAVCTSGGARMQEGIASLAQMARCSVGVSAVAAAKLPYISILADPCFGGVTASFAVQADVIIAEPKARVGFAGGRVIEQASHDRLPEGFQTSEFLLAHGMVDSVTNRENLRDTLALLLRAFGMRPGA